MQIKEWLSDRRNWKYVAAVVALVLVGWLNPFKNFQIVAFAAAAAAYFAARRSFG